jgi:hypothetical protein
MEIAILSIEIGNNQTKYLKIYTNSIASKLAYNFCLEYNLDYESLKKLTYEIKNLINETKNQHTTIKINKSFEKNMKKDDFNQSNKNKNKSMNNSPYKYNNKSNDKSNKKYNFIDIAKNIKKPYELDYKVQYKEKEKNTNDEQLKINFKKCNEENSINNNIIKNSNTKLNYLAPTTSSKSKIKKQKIKIKEANSLQYNKNVKIINIINNNFNYEKSENKKNQEINFGEKLYDKCMKIKKINLEKAQKEINLEIKKELIECTFKPKINTINIKCFKNQNNKEINKKVDNKANNNKNEIKEYNTKEINQKNEVKLISKKKQKTAIKEKSKSLSKISQKSVYERLYNLHSQRPKLEENKTLKSFIPKINSNKNYRNYINKSFKERQRLYSAKTTERKKILEKEIYNKIDSKTGQKLFHPIINKNYNINKFSSLSLDKRNAKLKKEKIKKEIHIKYIKSNVFKPNNKSDNIFEKQIIKSFKKIFSILDINLKGEISMFNYSVKHLPNSIINIISPILNNIDLKNKKYNEINFIHNCKKIFKNLDYYAKKEIYKFYEQESNKTEQINFYTTYSRLNTYHESEKNFNNLYSLTNYNNKENYDENNSAAKSVSFTNENSKFENKNKKWDVNDYYINGKNSKIYERFTNYKTFYKERPTKFFENLIIQRDDLII